MNKRILFCVSYFYPLFSTLIYRSTLLLISTYSDHFMIQPPYQTNLSPLALSSSFPDSAPSANPVFYRTYSRKTPTGRESWQQVCDRTLAGLVRLGHLTPSEAKLLDTRQRSLQSLSSGRWLWIGGTPWIDNPKNFSGGYNCTSTNVVDWQAFGLMMELAMMGCGTGAVLETHYIEKLPPIHNTLTISLTDPIGTVPEAQRRDETIVTVTGQSVTIEVGDSRRGWVDSYQAILELAADTQFSGSVDVQVSLAHVRPAGEALNGFGGVANPVKLPELYDRCARILNKAKGRQLTSVECCLLIDEAAIVVVAGNVRRSAGMRQFSSDDELAAVAKEDLWQQDEKGSWRIDPERDALRMANHTRVYHHKPTLGEITAAVRKQFYSGEGAIQYAPEAIARANIDLLASPDLKQEFLEVYASLGRGEARSWLNTNYPTLSEVELDDRLSRYGLNPCVTAETWVATDKGPQQVQDLIGQQHATYVNGELFSTTSEGFFYQGTKDVIKLETQEGYTLRLTVNHKLLKVTAQTQKAQYTDWIEAGKLQPGDRVLLHNHRDISPWDGPGSWEEGWLLGNLIGDGCFGNYQVVTNGTLKTVFPGIKAQGCHNDRHGYYQLSSRDLFRLALDHDVLPGSKTVTRAIERSSYDFHRGFLRGIFDADGSVQGAQEKGVSVRLSQSNLTTLQGVQRMLLRLGIVSTIYTNRRPEQIRLLPDANRHPAPYLCQAQHELVINQDNLQVFADLVGFQSSDKAQKLNDLLSNYQRKPNRERFGVRVKTIIPDGCEPVYDCTVLGPHCFDANGFMAHNCGEIVMSNNHCNLAEIHLNQIDPKDTQAQQEAFQAGALSVATLLNHSFTEARYQQSRKLDPIVGVSFTGLFDFCVHAFGVDWLHWWTAGRPDTPQGQQFKAQEKAYLEAWRDTVHHTVWDYCDRHHIPKPNRCTTVQPSGTKSLLTGASPGWHPPKAQRFIRRITFRKNDPVALACMDYGYSIIPSQSDKDEQGNLLDDPFDPRCTEWLVEIPTAVTWADIPGADQIDISQFSALAQFDFYMQVQRHYTTHNTSATIELREAEVEPLAQAIHQTIDQDQGYISAALLARFDDLQTFPRLPFEPICKEEYDRLVADVQKRRTIDDFFTALQGHDIGEIEEAGPAGCDSDKCLLPDPKA